MIHPRSRGPRRAAAAAALLGAAAAAAPASSARQLVRPEDALVALFTVQMELEVEQKILQREEARYEANVRKRAEMRERLGRLYEELEALFKAEQAAGAAEKAGERERERGAPGPDEIRQAAEAKEAEIVGLERNEAAARDEGRDIRDEIRRLLARIALIRARLEGLRASLPRDSDSVTGIWDIAILPSGDRGVFALWQTGTIVSGQYVLDGPFRGSLEGTLVNRQLLLRRIDARLGRSMEFSGYLAEDGQSVQGTWLNYDLSSGRSPSGSWTARKRASTPSETSRAPAGGESGGR